MQYFRRVIIEEKDECGGDLPAASYGTEMKGNVGQVLPVDCLVSGTQHLRKSVRALASDFPSHPAVKVFQFLQCLFDNV